jgi:hypothetical protein
MEKTLLNQMELSATIGGMNPMDYMSSIIERNDNDMITIEKGKLSISVLQQMNNRKTNWKAHQSRKLKKAKLKNEKQNIGLAVQPYVEGIYHSINPLNCCYISYYVKPGVRHHQNGEVYSDSRMIRSPVSVLDTIKMGRYTA